MDVSRLKEASSRLKALIENGSAEAIASQLQELDSAIEAISRYPQTYLHPEYLPIPDHWKVWPDNLGYAEPPYVRTDYFVIFRESPGGKYFAKMPSGPTGTYILDKMGRKRFWRHAASAIYRVDNDYPPMSRSWE
jgi:hypothetical protein